MRKITLEDIARMAGVSKATVSRVLNGKTEGYSRETGKRIRHLLEDVGYLQAEGQMPYLGRTKSIGLILPDITNPFFQSIADAVEDYAYQQDYTLLLGGTRLSAEREQKFISTFVTKRVDGIIMVVASGNQAAFQMLDRYQIPSVLLDRRYEGANPFQAGVFVDSMYPIYLACEHLIKHNCQHLVFISGPEGVSTARERYDGYRIALSQYSIDLDDNLVCYGDYTIRSGYECMTQIIQSNIHFDAIIAANDFMAIGALAAVREAGIPVPEKVEIIGFDGIDICEYITPTLSTIVQPAYEMGRKSAEMLFNLIRGTPIRHPYISMEAKLALRGTTRA